MAMTLNKHIERTIAAFAIVGTLSFGAWAGSAIASAEQGMIGQGTSWVDSCETDAYAAEVGDDNCDGVVMEDESGWSCAAFGNQICGPGNVEGMPAGRYDSNNVLVEPWGGTYGPDLGVGNFNPAVLLDTSRVRIARP